MDAILITGKTSLFSSEAMAYAGKNYHVLVTGRRRYDDDKESAANVRRFKVRPSDGDFEKIFETRRIRAVWHVASCADSGRSVDETGQMQRLLGLCAEHQVPRMIVLTENADPTNYSPLIRQWKKPQDGLKPVDIAVVRLPLLLETGLRGGRIRRIFRAMEEKKILEWEGFPESRLTILPVKMLTELLLRMTEETWFRSGEFELDHGMDRLESLRALFVSIRPDAMIEYEDHPSAYRNKDDSGRKKAKFRFPAVGGDGQAPDAYLADLYQFSAENDWQTVITEQYGRSMREEDGEQDILRKGGSVLRGFGSLIGTALDIAVMFFIAEYLARITSASVYFKVVDVRVLFVVLMGLMHGLSAGLIAGVLECIMLVIRYSNIGISGMLLFYNVENWIPFVYYLTAGVISGYTQRKNEQERKAVTAENDLIRRKYLFLHGIYQTCAEDRRELRAQILSEEESYDKLYNAMRRMSQRTPEAVFVESLSVFRHLLENETVCFYQIDSSDRQAHLLSCCMEGASRQFIPLRAYPDMMKAVRAGETWKNTTFVQGAPIYAQKIRFHRELKTHGIDLGNRQPVDILVTVEQASGQQMSLWYMNHFTILCGLLQDALENASLREKGRMN